MSHPRTLAEQLARAALPSLIVEAADRHKDAGQLIARATQRVQLELDLLFKLRFPGDVPIVGPPLVPSPEDDPTQLNDSDDPGVPVVYLDPLLSRQTRLSLARHIQDLTRDGLPMHPTCWHPGPDVPAGPRSSAPTREEG